MRAAWGAGAAGTGRFLVHEDDHLLVVDKPCGWNTHAPSPYAGEGVYEWLRRREPRWRDLAIIHRLDKETSGLLVFSKTEVANRELTRQFECREVEKRYLLVTDRPVTWSDRVIRDGVQRQGDRYGVSAGGAAAETRFRIVRREEGRTWIEAFPKTGRTHQIRVHAAAHGFPVLGDSLYGGTSGERVCLHAAELGLRHPVTGNRLGWSSEPAFFSNRSWALRAALVDPAVTAATTAVRWLHGAADGWPGVYVDQLGSYLLVHAELEPVGSVREALLDWAARVGATGVYWRQLARRVRGRSVAEASPCLLSGVEAADRFEVIENGVRYWLSLREGYSTGLFLDQRDNRRALLQRDAGPGLAMPAGVDDWRVLNTFAYTCGFSVCAALAGARVTSVDLSRHVLDWGRTNFVLNGLDPAQHDFLYGDVGGWLRRFARRGQRFEVVVIDPPTFSQSKEGGMFRVERDLESLVAVAAGLVVSGGLMLISTNAATLEPEGFVARVRSGVAGAGREIQGELYAPQPPDHPVAREEPAYLKTLWVRLRP